MQAERIARECQHVAKLPTAKDADCHTRFPFFFCAAAAAAGSGLARTRPVCSVRSFRTASRKERCLVPRMQVASGAALTAPDLPMARVPTGTAPGMWNTEGLKSLGGKLHGIPVAAGAHDDAD